MKDSSNNMTSHALHGVAASLNAFWIVNFIKTASPSFKDLLDFYPAVGPLLGVFLVALAVFAVVFWILRATNVSISEKVSYRYYVVTVVLFFFMVFPPVFEPIVELFE